MNKVYELITSVQLGGAEIVAMGLAEHGARDGNGNLDISLVELYPTRNDYAQAKKKELAAKNIRVITLCGGTKRLGLMLAPFKLMRHINKEKPEVIHSHTDLPDFVLSVAMRISKLFRVTFPRIVRTIHNTQLWRTHSKLGKFTESAYANDKIVAVSESALKAYEDLRIKNNLAVSPSRGIIYNGCGIPKPIQHPFKVDDDKINIAFCGRFEVYKGMDTLIFTIQELNRLYPDSFAFHIIGDGTYKNQLAQLAGKYGNVFLYGPVPNVSAMFHAFDYLFMPSHFEGLVLISIEASLSGVPVIASFAPGLDETLPEDWPLKFHLDNNNELFAIFKKIKNREYDLEFLKRKALDYASRKFSYQNMIDSYSELYTQMLR